MAMSSIATNVSAYYAQRNLKSAGDSAELSIGRLSSGKRIVRAADDVAAMSVGTVLETSVGTLKRALINASQANSMLQVADGGLANIITILQRQKTLATQATSGSLSSTERGFLNQEFQNLTNEVNRLVNNTKFNAVTLLDGTLGSGARLAATDAIAATLTANGLIATASNTSVQAFNIQTGASLQGTAAGNIQFVDDTNTALANGDFLTLVNPAVQGRIGSFKMSNVVNGVSATLSVSINGIEFSGSVANNSANIFLQNGTTRIRFTANAAMNFTNVGTAEASLSALQDDFANASIMRTSQVTGVNFTGTAMQGVTGAAASGTPMIRLSDSSNASIKNFVYEANGTAANDNVISVEIGGVKFYANNVNDTIGAAQTISFSDGAGQAFQINTTGLAANITNINTDLAARQRFIDALNIGFSTVAGGVGFATGTQTTDTITVRIRSLNQTVLYQGNSLSIDTEVNAATASTVLDRAIAYATSVRADVGAQQSRFNYAKANLETTIQNQDAARGVLLDTDVSAESTAYAQSQVLLQAGISVLAQANQLPQNLLKLIG
jgi:flagellin